MSLNSTDTKQIRKFGLIALIFFGFLCAFGVWREKFIPTYLFGFLATLGLGFLLLPYQLKPVFIGWLKIAHFIGRVITTLILTLAYYFVITPSGLIKRLFGGRPLPVKPDRNSSTYWVTRTEPVQPIDRFLKRY